jgi:hypothetical protein
MALGADLSLQSVFICHAMVLLINIKIFVQTNTHSLGSILILLAS